MPFGVWWLVETANIKIKNIWCIDYIFMAQKIFQILWNYLVMIYLESYQE